MVLFIKWFFEKFIALKSNLKTQTTTPHNRNSKSRVFIFFIILSLIYCNTFEFLNCGSSNNTYLWMFWGYLLLCMHVLSLICRVQLFAISHVQLFATLWTVSSVYKILNARILEWVAVPSSRGSSQPRDWSHISRVSCTGRRVLYL